MSIEIRETTKPAERFFTLGGGDRETWFVNGAELRELVEKAAEALGLWVYTESQHLLDTQSLKRVNDLLNEQNIGLAKENARLRAWLGAIEDAIKDHGMMVKDTNYVTLGLMARRALAGEEAPKP